MCRHAPFTPHPSPLGRRGFTLVELLVVMMILLIVLGITVYAVNFTLEEEKIRSGARQVQSYIEGARDRAIYEAAVGANAPDDQEKVVAVGVRFLPDETMNDVASSMVYIEKLEVPKPQGATITLQRLDADADGTPENSDPDNIWMIQGTGTDWFNLMQRGLLPQSRSGRLVQIRIPAKSGTWYTVDTSLLTASREVLLLSFPYRDPAETPPTQVNAFFAGNGPSDYELELTPVVRPNQEPVLLPEGIVIDLNRSDIPWTPGSQRMDLLFSPRGTVVGPAAGQGLIHFYLSGRVDAERLQNLSGFNGANSNNIPSNANLSDLGEPVGDRLIVTVFTRTGATSTHPVDPTDADGDNVADDPFRYSELGEVAGE